jgi:hypothetical protein
MDTYTDSRLITLTADSATENLNGDLYSSCFFSFSSLLKDESDILYRQVSVQTAQIPVGYYIVNIYNNVLSYKIGSGSIQTATFQRADYNALTFATEFHNQIPSMTLSFNKITGVYTITSSSSITIYSSGSTCFKLLGLNSQTPSYTGGTILCSYPCNFSGISRIKVVSNKLSTYSLDSTISSNNNVLAVIPVNCGSNGVILYQNISSFKPMLREINVNDFDISLLDDDDNLINFNGVSWSISLQIDIIRKLETLDRIFPKLTNTIPSQDKNNIVSSIDEPNNNAPLDLTTGDDDLDFLLYTKGIYQ